MIEPSYVPEHISNACPEGATEGEMQLWMNGLIAKAKKASEPTFTLLANRHRWVLFVADARTDTPKYYICNPGRLADDNENRKRASEIFKDFLRISSGQLDRSNTMYLSFPMQRHTPDASFPLAYWMRERMLVRMRLERTRPIKSLFHDCFNEWRIVTVNRDDLQKELVREVRAEIVRRDAELSACRAKHEVRQIDRAWPPAPN